MLRRFFCHDYRLRHYVVLHNIDIPNMNDFTPIKIADKSYLPVEIPTPNRESDQLKKMAGRGAIPQRYRVMKMPGFLKDDVLVVTYLIPEEELDKILSDTPF